MLPKAWTKFFLPGYTPYEISIQKVTMPLYFVSVIVFWGTVVSWVLILTGQAKTGERMECAVVVTFGKISLRVKMRQAESATVSKYECQKQFSDSPFF